MDPGYSSYDPQKAMEFYHKFLALYEENNAEILNILSAINSTIKASNSEEVDLTR
jgi:hypothetical protein